MSQHVKDYLMPDEAMQMLHAQLSHGADLYRFAAGTDATDAVNVSQLNATVSSATANAVVYDSAARSIVTLGGLGASVPVKLRNVAAGVLSGTSTDAVNGSQFYTTNQAVAANTGAIDALTNSLTDVQRSMARNTAQLPPIVSADALKYFAASSTAAPASASGTETVAAGGNALAADANSVAIGTSAQAIGSGALALGANTSAKGSNSIALGQGSAASADNTVSIGNSATGLTRTLTNVSAGVAPTDAVNVRQLSDAVGGLRSQIEHDRPMRTVARPVPLRSHHCRRRPRLVTASCRSAEARMRVNPQWRSACPPTPAAGS